MTDIEAYERGWKAAIEAAAKLHEPSCSCLEPCEDYIVWPGPCHKKAATVIRALADQITMPQRDFIDLTGR